MTWVKLGQIIFTCFARGSITVQLTSYLTDLDLAKQVKLLLINISKEAKSKQVKEEVSHIVILPLTK